MRDQFLLSVELTPAPELLQMPRKLPNDGNACAVTNTIDTWSFACVISVAATWLMLGLEGIKQFQMLRRAVIKTIPYPFLSDDAFHDGSTVLDVVTDWHKYLRRIVRTSDPISHRLLDLIDHEVLGRDPDSRLTTAALYNKLMDLLVVAKSELDEQIAESIVNRMISFDKTSLSNGGSHHEGAPNDNLSVESGRPASASKLQEHSPNPLNPLRISTITNAVDIPIYKAYSSLQSENQFKFVTIFRHKEDQYVSHFIKGRDIKFIVDNGSSMKKHWENVTATLLVLAQRVVASDEDGVDLVFTFADNKLGCRNVKDPWAKFSKAMRRAGGHISTDPQNPLATDMAKTLGEVFQEYERQRTKKRTTLIILTDGIWGGSVQPNEVEQKIADFFKGYKRTNSFEDRSFTIQFVSFGDQAIDKFDVLDDDMGKKYGIRCY
ncbi:hypothetical protein F4803DRAFT_305475 [Xylaria telfairii]|nr:hypothetical protein F4803DRAFT_305475 [Xylaria telfairii]